MIHLMIAVLTFSYGILNNQYEIQLGQWNCDTCVEPSITYSLPVYCPIASDFIIAYSTPGSSTQLMNQGWKIIGGAGVATKSAFNLLGGSVEYDVDFTQTQYGVNANIYTISPLISNDGFVQANYCDGQKTGADWCMELDFLEVNGFCCSATTLHTFAGPGNDQCSAWGCNIVQDFNGRTSFHMKVYFDLDGQMTATRDGQDINNNNLHPTPKLNDWAVIKSSLETRGAIIYSSQWSGWQPTCNSPCNNSQNGNLAQSSYSINNIKITGSVVAGPIPAACM